MIEDDGLSIADRVDEMPLNIYPTHPDFVRVFGATANFWPIRGESVLVYGKSRNVPEDVTGITIHHTMSHSPLALVAWLMERHGLDVGDVHGHRERWSLNTQCPGWGPEDRSQRSWGSGWKAGFYDALDEAVG